MGGNFVLSAWLAIACISHQGVDAFTFVGLPDGATLDACVNDTVDVAWNITLTGEEEVGFIQLFYNNAPVAMYSHGHFTDFGFPRIHFTPEEGLSIVDVEQGDGGLYSVDINVRNGTNDIYKTYHRTVKLLVATETSAETDATVIVKQEQTAVKDSATGEHHVQLTCRSRGRIPTAVVWTSTSGSRVVVTTHDQQGNFSLLLPNPVSGGTYTCAIHENSPAAKCLDSDNPALRGASVVVDEVKARLTLIEADLKTAHEENHDLRTENSGLKTHVDHLETSLDAMKQTEAALQTENQNLAALVHQMQQELESLMNDRQHVTSAATTTLSSTPRAVSTSATQGAIVSTVGETCMDKIDNCTTNYHLEQCCGTYQPWFQEHCAKSCGFCGVIPDRLCTDTIDYCSRLDTDLCSNDKWHVFRQGHCAGFCGLCDQPWQPPPCTADLFADHVATTTSTRK